MRNTPENTNWNVLSGMSGSGSDEWVEPDKGILVFSGRDKDYEDTPITIEEGSNFQTVEQLISWCFNGKHNVESDLEVKRIGYGIDPTIYTYNSSGSTDATKIFKYDWYSELYIGTDQVYLYTNGG